MSFQNTSIAHRLHLNELHYAHIDQLLDDRQGVECFRQFLHSYDQSGLFKLELWLTLRGYQREYERRQAEMTHADFVKWNTRCGKALANKYWSSLSEEDTLLRQQITRLRRTSEGVEQLRWSFQQKSAQILCELDQNHFFRFNQVPRHLPTASERANTSCVDSDAMSMCSNHVLKSVKKPKRTSQLNKGQDLSQVPPRRAINYHETELATNQPAIFAARLIAKLQMILNANDQDDFGSKVS